MHPSLIARTSSVLTTLVLISSPLAAQGTCYYIPDNGQSGANSIPFGDTLGTIGTWGNQKYQTLMMPATVGNVPVRITSLAVGGGATGLRHHDTLQIRMDYLQGSSTTLSTTFANNLSANAVTVLEATDYQWHQTAGTWCRLSLQKPFLYVPQLGPLVIEVTCTGSYFTGTGPAGLYSGSQTRLYAFRWTGQPPASGALEAAAGIKMQLCYGDPDLSSYSHGCTGSNNLVPKLTLSGSASLQGNLTVSLANALPSNVAFLAIGLVPYPVPVDLVIAGAPGCRLYHSVNVLQGLPTSATGTASLPTAVPNNQGLVGVSIYTQFAPLDPTANGMGITVSDFGRILIGL